MFIAMLSHPALGGVRLDSLRTGIMAGAPCPIEVMRQVLDRMHVHEITICDGMTETSPVSFHARLLGDDGYVNTVTGKIQKYKMREIWIAELGLSTAEAVRTA
jgi:acyl-CoA synthetase (AMP-forming)/AMP-acid ligase II